MPAWGRPCLGTGSIHCVAGKGTLISASARPHDTRDLFSSGARACGQDVADGAARRHISKAEASRVR